jgi:hypothetical protein
MQKEKLIKRNKKIEAKKLEIDRLEVLRKQKEFKDKVINEFVTNTSKTHRSNNRNEDSVNRSRSNYKTNSKLSESRNILLAERANTHSSKLKQYIKSVRVMYDEQMSKMKKSNKNDRFYDNLKKVYSSCLYFRNTQCL